MSGLVKKPWGFFQDLSGGLRHKIKVMYILPNESTSLQFHNNRCEHWVVVRGEVNVIAGNLERTVGANEYVFIDKKVKHSIANYKDKTAELIEVQFGEELSEGDIVRIQDKYGRANEN